MPVPTCITAPADHLRALDPRAHGTTKRGASPWPQDPRQCQCRECPWRQSPPPWRPRKPSPSSAPSPPC